MSTEKSDPAGGDGESLWVLQLMAELAVNSMCRYIRKKRVGETVIKRERERRKVKYRCRYTLRKSEIPGGIKTINQTHMSPV